MRNWRIVLTIGLIIILSGCIFSTKNPLRLIIIKEANDEELISLISYIETYDILDFVKIPRNDTLVFQGFSSLEGVFVRNISQFLIDAKQDYKESSWYKGTVYYYITGMKVSRENILSIETALSREEKNHDYNFDQFDSFIFINYYPRNSSLNSTEYIASFFNHKVEFMDFREQVEYVYLSEEMWVIVCWFGYSATNQIMGGSYHDFAEMFILDATDYRLLVMTAASQHNTVD